MPANQTHLLQVRLTEAEKRRIKTLAASQGLTLRQATLQAFEAWASQLPSRAPAPNPARGTPAAADLQKPGQPKRAATSSGGRRRGADHNASPVRSQDAQAQSSHETRLGAGAESATMDSPPQDPVAHFARLAPRGGAVGLVEMSSGAERTGENRQRLGGPRHSRAAG